MDQLDKTEPPVIPENHLPSLGLTGIFMVSKGLGSFVLPNYPRISLMEPSESTTPFNSFKNEVTKIFILFVPFFALSTNFF